MDRAVAAPLEDPDQQAGVLIVVVGDQAPRSLPAGHSSVTPSTLRRIRAEAHTLRLNTGVKRRQGDTMSNEFGIGGVQAGLRRMAALLPQLCGAFAAGLVAGAIEIGDNSTGAIVLGAYLVAGWYSARAARWRWLLPMAGLLAYGIMAVLGTAFSIVALLVIGRGALVPAPCLRRARGPGRTGHHRPRLLAVDADQDRRDRLAPRGRCGCAKELDREQSRGFEVGATIVPDEWDFDPAALDAPYLCSLSEIGDAIDDRDLEALVVTREFDRARGRPQALRRGRRPPRAGDGAPRVPRAPLRLGAAGRDRLRVVHAARRIALQAAHACSQARPRPRDRHPGGDHPGADRGGDGRCS